MNIEEATSEQIGRWWASTPQELSLEGLTPEQVRAELERRQAARMASYSYIGSKQHLKDLTEKILESTHAPTTPPWED